MSTEMELAVEQKTAEGGKIIFASEVIATIAGLAASEVKGVAGMSGGVVEGITQILGRKNLTKGIKVEVGSEEVAADVSVIVEYGNRIHEVCAEVQRAVKNAVETMTGLRVVEVNVFVQSVSFEKPDPEQKAQKALKEKAEKSE